MWRSSRPLPGTGLNSGLWCRKNVDTSVPHGRGGGARGGLQGLSQGQGSTAVCGAEHVDTPVPHGGDLHGLSQGQGCSTALCGADHVDIPVPHGRVGERGLHGFSRGQSSTASAVEQTIGVDQVFKVFLLDRVPQRLPLSRLFLRLLIDRNHEPRFMAVMTSGCA